MKGFSLIEIMIVLFVLSILSWTMLPRALLTIEQAHEESNKMKLKFFLEQAMRIPYQKHQHVLVCGTKDGRNCDVSWDEGVIAYTLSKGLKHRQRMAYARFLKHDGVLHARMFSPAPLGIVFYYAKVNLSDNALFWYCKKNEVAPSWVLHVLKQGGMYFETKDKENKNTKCS